MMSGMATGVIELGLDMERDDSDGSGDELDESETASEKHGWTRIRRISFG